MIFFCLFLTGCLGEETSQQGEESDTSVVSEPAPGIVAPPLTAPERTICDPFSSGPVARDRGLVGNLLYFNHCPGDIAPAPGVQNYIDNAEIVESTIYMDRMFIPTRPWDRPFTTETGNQIMNSCSSPTPVYEYFGLRMESQLQLAANDPEGEYQFAILSDDGSIMSWKNEDETETEFINNDGNHPTRMKCATTTVNMTRETKKPFVLKYYQGPRYHISMIVMMRLKPTGTDPDIPINEVECDKQGNSRYFDSTQSPVATQAKFYELLSRGWKVLENENYHFPVQASNPCIPQEETLFVSSFAVQTVTKNSVTLTWATNIGASSQIEVKNIATGVITHTVEVAGPNTSHTVTATGLTANTLYSFKAISRTASGQVAYSDEKALRTPR